MTPHAEALTLLEALTRRGVELRAEGERILFRPAALLDDQDRAQVRALKPYLLELLASAGQDMVLLVLCVALPADDALDLREERAGILEHLGGLPRAEAERRAGLGQVEPIMGPPTGAP
jgi:hypothetical protein